VGSNPQALEQIIANLNNQIALPWDIVVSFEDCEQSDAFYDPENRKLTVCYQLIDEYYDLFGRKIKDKTKLDEVVRGAVASTFFHELGHGLVDAWKVPITGKEEDAVDQLSTLILIKHTQNGEQMALDGAISFKLYADLEKASRNFIGMSTHWTSSVFSTRSVWSTAMTLKNMRTWLRIIPFQKNEPKSVAKTIRRFQTPGINCSVPTSSTDPPEFGEMRISVQVKF
jgi:hypothetical protein